MQILTLAFFILLSHYVASAAKILTIFPMPARSHYILGSTLAKALAEKGHDVTMISAFAEENPPKNVSYRNIVVKRNIEGPVNGHSGPNMFALGEKNPFVLFPFLSDMLTDLTRAFFEHPSVQKLMASEEKFDLVIVQELFFEAHKGLANHFGASLMTFSTIGAGTWTNILIGNPGPPSYIPDTLLGFSSNMNFCERLYNSIFNLYTSLLINFQTLPNQKVIYDKYFPNAPDFYDTIYNSSILLLNSHPTLHQPVPYVPNMVDIGGFHVKPPKALPKDLQNFLDEAKEGVVYFSMGSNLKSVQFPTEKRDAFLKTFAKLKEKVLWKWEDDVLPGQPENVKLSKWLPQQDILAHPNVKLFITHGGLLSTTETLYHGVPVLSIPVTGDQKLNAQYVASQGYGIMIPYQDVTEEVLTRKLQEILTDDKYTKTAKVKSKLFHDRLVNPMDTAIYWVEYVIRHRGTSHLHVAGMKSPWYQYHLIDVIVFLVVSSLILLYISYLIVKKLIFSRFTKSKKKVKKN